jgi:DNA-binding NarL/FixJ family response regulator
MDERNIIMVVSVDDHEVVREGLRLCFSSCEGVSIVGQADSGARGYDLVRRTLPDVAVLDLRLPDTTGLELCARIRAGFPSTAVVLLSSYLSEDMVRQAVRVGAADYVTKGAELRRLEQTVRKVASGWRMSAGDASAIVQDLDRTDRRGGQTAALTPRQEQVAELIVDGNTYAQIAGKLHISESTVRFHVQALKERFGVRSKAELIATVVRFALVTPPDRVAEA